jgi:hypothetical protein
MFDGRVSPATSQLVCSLSWQDAESNCFSSLLEDATHGLSASIARVVVAGVSVSLIFCILSSAGRRDRLGAGRVIAARRASPDWPVGAGQTCWLAHLPHIPCNEAGEIGLSSRPVGGAAVKNARTDADGESLRFLAPL